MFPKAYFPKQYMTGSYFPPVDGVIPPVTEGYGLGGPRLDLPFPFATLASPYTLSQRTF